ncbi:MAG: heme-copper oxidase subunit III [Bryobacteraceae bacterium]|jgi:cytochrome c oxidase subunit 3/cytochrome o ubiquinol oxidase subunit 3
MSAFSMTISEREPQWRLPARGPVAMYCLIAAESAIFTIFVVAYIFYLGKSATGPQPSAVLHAPTLLTICLLLSSLTIHIAVNSLKRGDVRRFAWWWGGTVVLGGIFLAGTGGEWHHLIYQEGVTLQTNLFGTTYYSLVGLHAFHVVMGLAALTVVLAFAIRGDVRQEHSGRTEVLSMYWHFVDAVWVVVFTVVYLIGR